MTEHWMGYYLHFDDGHYRNPKRRREKRKKKMHDNFWRTLTERRVGKLHFPFIGLDFGNGQEYGTLGANLPSHTHPWLSPRYRDDERETPRRKSLALVNWGTLNEGELKESHGDG